MAKKAVAATSTLSNVEAVEKSILDNFGKNVLQTANSFIEREKRVIPFSPAMDIALGGGIEEGSWVTMSGPPKCGKTSSLLHFARQCQKPENGSRHVYYFNIEGRLKKRDVRLAGMDMDKFKIIQSGEGNILTGEKWLSIIEQMVRGIPDALFIVDSVSAICPEKEYTSEIGTGRSESTRLVAQLCRKLANIVPVNRSIVCCVKHLIANTSGYGAAFNEDGGNKVTYQVDVWLQAKNGKPKKIVEDGIAVGQKIEWTVHCSSLGSPVDNFSSILRYGMGLDESGELSMLGQEFKIIESSGAWYYMPDFSLPEDQRNDDNRLKFQGEAKLRRHIEENPDVSSELKKLIVSYVT